jgi:type IV pilus biogenesis protein CpaD/CtpE
LTDGSAAWAEHHDDWLQVRGNPMRALIAILVLSALAGCASTSKMMVGEARPAISPEQVRIYSQPPPRYQEIAVLETQSGGFTYGEQSKMDEVLANLRKSAAELGANGVLIEGHGNAYSGSSVGVGVGRENWGSSSSTGVGVGFSISPSPKHARAVAIWVDPADVPTYSPPVPQQPTPPSTPAKP